MNLDLRSQLPAVAQLIPNVLALIIFLYLEDALLTANLLPTQRLRLP